MLTANQLHSGARKSEQGFTLIELSIVLVIIGLIVGGVLVGQDLIRAAEVRATISQIERYNTATNTFRGKFNAIPGDMNPTTAATFGFSTRAGTVGLGDGNGLLTGPAAPGAAGYLAQGGAETGMYWVDVSSNVAGNLIDSGFSGSVITFGGAPTASGTALAQYFPNAKLGRGNMIYVYEQQGSNYFGMSAVSGITAGSMVSGLTLSPLQAYNIDTKMDDGIATSGNVKAVYLGGTGSSAVAADPDATSFNAGPSTGTYSATACYDQTSGLYVTQYQNGQGAACGLSFKFQ